MRRSIAFTLPVLLFGCAENSSIVAPTPLAIAAPLVSPSLPEGSSYAHLTSVNSLSDGPIAASVSEVLLPTGQSALERSSDSGSLQRVPILTNFFIRPGHYRLGYHCRGVIIEIPLYAEADIAPGKNYEMSCTRGSPHRFVIRAVKSQ